MHVQLEGKFARVFDSVKHQGTSLGNNDGGRSRGAMRYELTECWLTGHICSQYKQSP